MAGGVRATRGAVKDGRRAPDANGRALLFGLHVARRRLVERVPPGRVDMLPHPPPRPPHARTAHERDSRGGPVRRA